MLSRISTSDIPGNPSLSRLAPRIAIPQSRLDRVRGAGVAFVRGTLLGCSRRDLADWLVCQYAPSVTPPLYAERNDYPPGSEAPLDDAFLQSVIVEARVRVLELLADLVVPWRATSIARLAVACGTVAPERDACGGVAYAPVRLTRMRLSQRVGSLFIADYLNRSVDYRWVMMCCGCGELAFAAELAHASWCEAPPEEWIAFTPAEAIHAAWTA